MDFRLLNFRLPLVAGALSAVVLSVAAQDGAPQSGQAIIFSTPAGGNTTSNALSLFPQPSDQPSFVNELRAPTPVPFLDFEPPAEPLPTPPPAPAVSSAEAKQLQRMLDERKNWALLTPAEILGVSVPEKPSSTLEQAAADSEKTLTVLERYLERQQQSPTAATNGYYNDNYDNSSAGWDFLRNQGGLTNESSFNPARPGLPTAAQVLNRLFNTSPDNNLPAEQNEDAGWLKTFGLPPQPVAPTPAQQAETERFRQLLEPNPYADTKAKSLPDSQSLSSLQPLPDPNLNPAPFVNPVGAPFTPFNSGVGKPMGLTPLPGVTGPQNLQTVATPSWMPQPPPWLSQTPQPFTMPQRRF
jgi:hypothetical protein